MRLIQIAEERNGSYRMEMEITKSATGSSDEWNTFHEVRVLGYTRSGELVCEKELGAVSHDGQQTIEITCSGFPYLLTFDAAESPCDEDTEIKISTYQGVRTNAETDWFSSHTRTCNEGLPPEHALPDDTTGTDG